MSATFSGPIGGYVTVHNPPAAPPKETPKPEPSPSKQPESKETPTPKETPKETPKPSPTPKETPKETPSQQQQPPSQTPKASSSTPTAIRAPAQTHSESDDSIVKATGSPTHSSSPTQLAVDGNRAHSAASSISPASATTTPTSVSGGSSGTSAGAKAGIAIGVLGGIALVGLLIFFLIRRRKQQSQLEQLSDDDEKAAPPPPVQQRAVVAPVVAPVVKPVMTPAAAPVAAPVVAAAAAAPVARAVSPMSFEISPAPSPEPMEDPFVRTNPNAPRISLRPVTQFLPGWDLEKQTAAVAGAGAVGVAVTGDGADRPSTSQSSHPANPFGQQAERVPSPISDAPTPQTPTYKPYTPSVMSMAENAPEPDPFKAEETVAVAAAVAATGVVVAAGTTKLARKASMKNKNNVDLTVNTMEAVPPSPTGSVSSATLGSAPNMGSSGAAAIAAAGGPANSTVHRVQLDFKPSLEDELELKAGDLVRLLHEYDDGWVSSSIP